MLIKNLWISLNVTIPRHYSDLRFCHRLFSRRHSTTIRLGRSPVIYNQCQVSSLNVLPFQVFHSETATRTNVGTRVHAYYRLQTRPPWIRSSALCTNETRPDPLANATRAYISRALSDYARFDLRCASRTRTELCALSEIARSRHMNELSVRFAADR